ncbi:MAG: substrate-binding domain-containing protein [Rikenellaceae bacterium]
MEKSDVIRIKDIAAVAGVSEGTVDRVIHKRGSVSQKSRLKVEAALQEMNYTPNIYASALAFKRMKHNIVSLTPAIENSAYWQEVERGVEEAYAELKALNINLERYYFDQNDYTTFEQAKAQILANPPQGVIFTPTFAHESIDFIDKLAEMGVGATIFDSHVESEKIVSYFGQNGVDSGRLISKLMMMNIDNGDEVLLFLPKFVGNKQSTQIASRYSGFMDYLDSNNIKLKVTTLEIPIDDEVESLSIVIESIKSHPKCRAMVAFNSRVFIMAEALAELKRDDIVLFGFDVLAKSVEAMKSGHVTALIGTHPRLQGYRALKSLCESVILKRDVIQYNYMPLDVLMVENINYYTTFKYQ